MRLRPVSEEYNQCLPIARFASLWRKAFALSLFMPAFALGCQLPTGEMFQEPVTSVMQVSPLPVTRVADTGPDILTADSGNSVTHPPLERFRATYRANYRGLPIRANGVRELIHEPDGSFRLTTEASAMFISVSEETRFHVQNGRISPLSYLYQRRGLGRNKTVSQRFDKQNAQITHENGVTTTLPDGAYDKLLYQLQMKRDLSDAAAEGRPWPEMNYTVIDGTQPKHYRFRVIGTEEIDTPIGPLMTIKTARVRENSARETTFWLSPEHDFLLVQLQQIEPDGSGFELYLKGLER